MPWKKVFNELLQVNNKYAFAAVQENTDIIIQAKDFNSPQDEALGS